MIRLVMEAVSEQRLCAPKQGGVQCTDLVRNMLVDE